MESRIFYPRKPVFTYKEHKQVCFHAWTEAVLSNELPESKFWTIKMTTGINISVSSTYLFTELKYRECPTRPTQTAQRQWGQRERLQTYCFQSQWWLPVSTGWIYLTQNNCLGFWSICINTTCLGNETQV